MRKLIRKTLLVTAGILAATTPGFAEHFKVSLSVQGPEDSAEAFMDTTPPIGGVNPRHVVKVKPGDTVQIAWSMQSDYPHDTMPNVTVHFFIVPESRLGQKETPDLGKDEVLDNSLTTDFKPDDSVKGTLRIKAPAPGYYLVRVQSEGTEAVHGHEHFSAVDLQVQ